MTNATIPSRSNPDDIENVSDFINLTHCQFNTIPYYEGNWGIGIINNINLTDFIFNINDKHFSNGNKFFNKYNIYNCNNFKFTAVEFVADPFLYETDDGTKWYLFYELKNFDSNRGEIGVSLSVNNGVSWKYLGIALAENFHLSYPNVINNEFITDKLNVYMIPETSEDFSIRIYKTTKISFPFHWQLHVKKLADLGQMFVDTNVIYYNQTYFIFTTDVTPNNNALYIFYTEKNSDLFDSDWHSHFKNPFYFNNLKYCRSAGNPYYDTYNNHIYRFSQDSTNMYGEKIHIHRIVKLNTLVFEEILINTIEPSIFNFDQHEMRRTHHINIHSNVIVFDFDNSISYPFPPNMYMNVEYKDNNMDNFNELNVNVSDIYFINFSLPKLIHFIWISDDINNDNTLDEHHRKNINTFYDKYYQQKWTIIVWTNEYVRNVFCNENIISQNEEECAFLMNVTLSKQYEVTLSMKSDVLRYMIMYEFGGMYVDTDFVSIQSLQEIIIKNIDDHGLILCNEVENESLQMSSGFFVSYPNNKCVETAKNNIMDRIKMKHLNSDWRTGPKFWKRAIVAAFYNNSALISRNIDRLLLSFDMSQIATELPTNYMYSLKYNDNETIKNEIIESNHSDIYAIHLWEGSWLHKNSNNNHGNFILDFDQTMPFRKEWYFDYFRSIQTSKSLKQIEKLKFPSLLFQNFKYHNDSKFPFYNPSIIRIDTIPKYHAFMLSKISLNTNINIISNTMYLAIGRWNFNQCERSQRSDGHGQSHFLFDIDNARIENIGTGIILLDSDWNILSYVKIELHFDNNIYEVNSDHLQQLQDCRLFNYLSLVFTNCMIYENMENNNHLPSAYIGAVLWKESEDHQISAYLESRKNIDILNELKMRELYFRPNEIKYGYQPKNIIGLEYDEKLYFQWELSHSYFIEINLSDKYEFRFDGVLIGRYSFHNPKPFSNPHNMLQTDLESYHLNTGFIHLSDSKEFLGIGHTHYDLYDFMHLNNPFDIKHGHHYSHFFYTIDDSPPFRVRRMSDEFCFLSPYTNFMDCDVIQFVAGMVENTIDGIEYLFVSYGINDCISAVAKMNKQMIMNMLQFVTYNNSNYKVLSYDMKIFSLSVEKTGISSLGNALEILGYDNIDWKELLYDESWNTIDFKVWYDSYPNAKFILLERDDESWLHSMETHYSPKYNVNNISDQYLDYKWLTAKNSTRKLHLKWKHQRYKKIKQFFNNKNDKLLIMNISDGWKILCSFLNKSIPSITFPYTNKYDSSYLDTSGPIHINKPHRVLYCAIKKNAHTMYKNLIYAIHVNTSHVYNPAGLLAIHDEDIDDIEDDINNKYDEILHDKSWTKLVVIRDPLERLISGYLSVCVRSNQKPQDPLCVSSTFSIFVERLIGNIIGKKEINWHFRPQSTHCHLRTTFNKYNYVIKYEYNDIGNKTLEFLKSMNLSEYYMHWGPFYNETMFHRKTKHVTYNGGENIISKAKFYGKYYTKELALKCVHLFEQDYKIFNLSYPSWIDLL